MKTILRQKTEEIQAAYHSNRILFVDTDALTTKFYSRFSFERRGRNQKVRARWQIAVTEIHRFDLILFLEPTVDFVQDGTRNEVIAADRGAYSRQLKSLFDEKKIPYHSLSGDYLDGSIWQKN